MGITGWLVVTKPFETRANCASLTLKLLGDLGRGSARGLQIDELLLLDLFDGADRKLGMSLPWKVPDGDPGFTLRTYAHLMPDAADRARKAMNAFFDDEIDKPSAFYVPAERTR